MESEQTVVKASRPIVNGTRACVLLFSQCAIYRKGLEAAEMAAQGFHLAGSTNSLETLPTLLETLTPDVLAIDGHASRKLIEKLLDGVRDHPGLTTVILNSPSSPFDIAGHHLPPNIEPELLPLALRLLRSGLQVVSGSGEPSSEMSLGAAELEVLRLKAQGFSLRAIAAAVCMSESTVKRDLTRIARKLEVENAKAAVLWAANRNLI